MSKRSFFAASFFGIALLLGALAVWQRERQMWVPVAGEVVRVWDREIQQPPQETKYGIVPPREVTIPLVDYSYRVDGRGYSGTAPVSPSGGAGLTVYYDPDHPERSRLDRPKSSALFVVLTLAGAFFVAGLRLWLGGPSGQRVPRTEPA